MAESARLGKKLKKNPVRRTEQLGLILPVARVEKILRELTSTDRVSGEAAIAITAAVEGIMQNLISLSLEAAQMDGKRRIKARHIAVAVGGSDELRSVISMSGIRHGGVMPMDDDKLKEDMKKKKKHAHKRAASCVRSKSPAKKKRKSASKKRSPSKKKHL